METIEKTLPSLRERAAAAVEAHRAAERRREEEDAAQERARADERYGQAAGLLRLGLADLGLGEPPIVALRYHQGEAPAPFAEVDGLLLGGGSGGAKQVYVARRCRSCDRTEHVQNVRCDLDLAIAIGTIERDGEWTCYDCRGAIDRPLPEPEEEPPAPAPKRVENLFMAALAAQREAEDRQERGLTAFLKRDLADRFGIEVEPTGSRAEVHGLTIVARYAQYGGPLLFLEVECPRCRRACQRSFHDERSLGALLVDWAPHLCDCDKLADPFAELVRVLRLAVGAEVAAQRDAGDGE